MLGEIDQLLPARRPPRPIASFLPCFHACILLLSLAACKTTHSATSETHLSEATEAHSKGETVVTTTTTQGPETITTITEEFAPPTESPEEVMPSASEHQRLRGSDPDLHAGVPATQGVMVKPSHGALVKRTTVTDVRGPSLSESHSDARASTETHAETKVEAKAQTASTSSPSASCAFGGMLCALAVIGLALVVFAAVRKRMF